MGSTASIVIPNSTFDPAARCIVCGGDIAPGEGLTARFGETALRFKCADCLDQFETDPDRFLAGHPQACCPDEGHAADSVSEWICDR